MKVKMTHRKPKKEGVYLVRYKDCQPYTVDVIPNPAEDMRLTAYDGNDDSFYVDECDEKFTWSEIIEVD